MAKKGSITIKYIRSAVKRTKDQQATIRGLGFRKLHQSRTLPNTPQVRGMIKKVLHMIQVEGEN